MMIHNITFCGNYSVCDGLYNTNREYTVLRYLFFDFAFNLIGAFFCHISLNIVASLA